MPRDRARHRGRAVHAGEDADVVARRDAAVGAHDALEGRRLARRTSVSFTSDAKGVVALEVAHRQVVHVHVLAGLDVARGEADDLVVAPHRLALRDVAHRELVAGRDACTDRAHVFFLDQRVPVGELDARDDDVVVGVQADGEVGGLQHGAYPLLQRMARHQLVRMHPAGKRRDALEPCADARVIGPAYAEFVGPVQVAAHREVGDRRLLSRRQRSSSARCLSRMPSELLIAPAQELGHRRSRRFSGKRDHEAQGGDVARELVVVPQHPAQDFELVFAPRICRSGRRGNAGSRPTAQRRLPPCSSTGTSPISLILPRYSGVRVSPLKKSTKRGSHFAPHRFSISATLNALPDCAKQ